MSKYDALWKYVSKAGKDAIKLSYKEIDNIMMDYERPIKIAGDIKRMRIDLLF